MSSVQILICLWIKLQKSKAPYVNLRRVPRLFSTLLDVIAQREVGLDVD
jgi:hypothetical protein